MDDLQNAEDLRDLRSSARISVDLDAEILKEGRIIHGTVLNCSLSGIFIRTPELKMEEGEFIEVRIHLPGIPDPITATSCVIWTDWNEKTPPGFGMHFVSLTDDQATLLRAFLYE
jgi:hypothetical protein